MSDTRSKYFLNNFTDEVIKLLVDQLGGQEVIASVTWTDEGLLALKCDPGPENFDSFRRDAKRVLEDATELVAQVGTARLKNKMTGDLSLLIAIKPKETN